MPFSRKDAKLINSFLDNKGISVSPHLLRNLERFHDLVVLWSGRMNLVSRNDLNDLVRRHILDSLTPIELIPDSGELIDVGSGAGFPGVIISLVRPGLMVTLVESIHKKVLFLEKAKELLPLKSTEIFEGRLEDFTPGPRFDLATVRAVSRWERLLPALKNLMQPSGKIIYYEKRGKCRILDLSKKGS